MLSINCCGGSWVEYLDELSTQIDYYNGKAVSCAVGWGLVLSGNLLWVVVVSDRTPKIEEALSRIDHCKNSKETSLDLGSLSLTALPAEIAELDHLQQLDCSWNKITDLSPLAGLSQLQTLKCWDNRLTDLAPLAGLSQLQTLWCSGNQLTDLAPLAGLSQLQTLWCSGNQLTDIAPLAGLSQLQTLKCNWNQLTDIAPLAGLSQLQTLDCNWNQLTDLSPLAGLSQLQTLNCSLNQLTDLSPLAGLSQLQTLDCNWNQLTDLSPLAGLSQLQTLDCGSNQLTDLLPLAGLSQLQTLNCGINQLTNLSPLVPRIIEGQFEQLVIYNNPIHSLPDELQGKDEFDNVAAQLSDYFRDLEQGGIDNRSVKLLLTGNGRIGKTTLANALLDRGNIKCTSTHGVVIERLALDDWDVQLWDFGGQEIYHATHRLFLSQRAFYLLLWCDEQASTEPDEQSHPVSYWLDYIGSLSNNSPLILVKNKIDLCDKLTSPTGIESFSDRISRRVKVSAEQGLHLQELKGALKGLIEQHASKLTYRLPQSWAQVRQELETRKARGETEMPLAQFRQICSRFEVIGSDSLRTFLHDSGCLFYLEGRYRDRIILDQNRLIDAVYRIFDRDQNFRQIIEANNGQFSAIEANSFFEEQDNAQECIDFMNSCDICVELEPSYKKEWEQRRFLVPQMLPEHQPAKINISDLNNQYTINYPFLHASIRERFLIAIARQYSSDQSQLWRHGAFFNADKQGKALVTFDIQNNQIKINTDTNETTIQWIIDTLHKVFPSQEKLQAIAQDTGQTVDTTDARADSKEKSYSPKTPEPKQLDKKTIKIFISYCQQDSAYKGELEKRLRGQQRIRENIEFWSDDKMFTGDIVEQQISDRLNTADIVCMLISANFIDSDYCYNTEMKTALKNYKKGDGIPVPIIIQECNWQQHPFSENYVIPNFGKTLPKTKKDNKYWKLVDTELQKLIAEKFPQNESPE